MTGVVAISNDETGLLTISGLPLGYTTVDFGMKVTADSTNTAVISNNFPSVNFEVSTMTTDVSWVRLDVNDTLWRADNFSNDNGQMNGHLGAAAGSADKQQAVGLYSRSHFSHTDVADLVIDMSGAIGIETLASSPYHFTTWVDITVIPPAAKKNCPHEIRARPLGKYFKSDLYVWNPESACGHGCEYCEKQLVLYTPMEERRRKAKEARQVEKARERDTLGEVMLYLLERTKKADEKEKCAREILAPASKKEEVDPDRGVLEGLLKLPKSIQPKAMLVMAHCPCSCGKRECDICGCHELVGCESGMRIPRADSAEYLELKKFWMTALSNLNDDKSLCDLARRQGAYRSIRAFLCSEATQGEKL
jgi:hypothetical protein